jgi:GT2 family glycosyltransferase
MNHYKLWNILIIIFLIILILINIYLENPRIEYFNKDNASNETIFISVASYRDDVCMTTLKDIFDNAEYKNRVYVGICQQNKHFNESCYKDGMDESLMQNIRILSIPHLEAKGPTYARYLCSTLYRGERYFMQIDSHTNFEKNWDTIFIEMMSELKSKGILKPVLSQYPIDIDKKEDQRKYVGVLCECKFDDNGIITLGSVLKEKTNDYYKTPFTAGGFIFMEGSALNEVPFDPNLPFLFQGEEILYSARLWTHGYDIFTPKETVLYHHYIRKDKPKFWDDMKSWHEEQTKTYVKLKYILGLSKELPSKEFMQDLTKYGLGSERSLDNYWKFAHINVSEKKSETDKYFC